MQNIVEWPRLGEVEIIRRGPLVHYRHIETGAKVVVEFPGIPGIANIHYSIRVASGLPDRQIRQEGDDWLERVRAAVRGRLQEAAEARREHTREQAAACNLACDLEALQ